MVDIVVQGKFFNHMAATVSFESAKTAEISSGLGEAL